MNNDNPSMKKFISDLEHEDSKMKSLYDVNNRYTVEAQALDASVGHVLKPYFDKLVDAGYSPREIAHVIQGVANELEMEAILNQPRPKG